MNDLVSVCMIDRRRTAWREEKGGGYTTGKVQTV